MMRRQLQSGNYRPEADRLWGEKDKRRHHFKDRREQRAEMNDA